MSEKKSLPPINQRIKILIDKFFNGNTTKCAREIGVSSASIFNATNFNSKGKIISPSYSSLIAFINKIDSLNGHWLLTGESEMLIDSEYSANSDLIFKEKYLVSLEKLTAIQDDLITVSKENIDLRKEIERLKNAK